VALLRNFFEGPAVAVECGFPAGQRLPALHYDINVFGVKLDAEADALGEFRGGERRAAAQKRFLDEFPAPEMLQDRTPR
jgi:hypothetical protein